MQGIAALQPYVIAVFLAWAGLAKLSSRARPDRTALARLVGPARAVPALRLVALAELAVAAVLVLPPHEAWEGTAAAALSAGFLGYLVYARVSAPASSCGCLGAHATPLNRRAFLRAGLLLAMSVAAVWAGPQPPDAWLAGLGVVELAVLLGLSAELDRHWLTPLRRLIVRVRKPLATTGDFPPPLEASLRQLYRSPAYCSVSRWLSSDAQDAWDEDGTRFVAYAASGRTAVFAIPLWETDPALVRVVVVDEPEMAVDVAP
ncbi:MauE/DoxX family redox-associated membrane protein [Nonomuraea sediminis]|uniref:MauE/DoxX family redox-associated membrane protein n=1 Tax=Nonomuraea sediminis TaxID=2835864 RepID=UPI001BDC6524|nr:MauE/DoxX family redox-associated membrane protein [Nonomuraea sediminis]